MTLTPSASASAPAPHVTWPGAALAGFVALIPGNVIASAVRKGSGQTSAGAWVAAQASGAGQLVFCGLVSALALFAWQRTRPRRLARFDLVALFVVVGVLGAVAVGPDFAGFVERVEAFSKVPSSLLGALFCLAIVGGFVFVARLVARRLPWAAVGIGLALGFANNFLLELDYSGIHLVIGWAGALAVTVGLAARALPWLAPSRRQAIVMGALAPLAIASLVWRPSESAWRKLLEIPGAFAAPYVTQLVPELSDFAGGEPGDKNDPWMTSRAGRPPIPPSRLSPLPQDGLVILLVCDALRADVVKRGETAVPMPNLEKLRKRSVEFTMARSAAPSTLSSMTSVFTGKYYSQLHAKGGSKEEGDTSADETLRVPELLSPEVTSYTVFPTRLLDPKRGATRGFEAASVKEKSPSSVLMPKVKKRLDKGLDGPFFLYLHWMDAHSPYDLGGTEGTPREAYLREVAILDERIGELVAYLDDKSLTDRTTLIVTADHGESFGDHGTWEHGKTVYEELLRVPMWIVAPGKAPRIIDTPVSTIDLGATVLDLFGHETPGHFMGQSLLPLAFGKGERVAHPIAAEAGHKLRAFYSTDDMKVIFDRARKTTEVYDLTTDPNETKNIADTPEAKPHITRARRFFKAHQVAEEAKR